MTRIAGLLFDFDGTLAELHIDFEAMRRQVAELAAVFMDQAPEASTAPVLEWIDQLAARMSRDLPREDVLEFRSRCRMRLVGLEMKAAARGRLFPFTQGVLAGLQDKGVRTAVVTRNCTPAVKTVYPQIMQEVDCLLAREDVQRVKPDPDHLLQAIRTLGVRPEECCMVGDHWLDIQAAHRAGIRSAAVHTGRISGLELARYGPDFSVPDVHSLVRELSRFGLLQADCRDRTC
ncbi:HAD family hydrolase [Desulfovermiculus halophilus]|jgi:phosphoglycolate phosphatase|uniref:HAD family hydrolase n=1 Tax=Desulfovermiculus halophilus TaxID=339722 RepID=UPI000482F080|nr:HAD family hydrolase [Desulfovermiculus halophilus]